MSVRRTPVLLLALLVLSGSLSAQEDERLRFRLPDRAPTTAELEARLKRRQTQSKDEEQVRKLVEEVLKGKFDADALRQLQRDLQQNPDLKKQIENRLLNQPDLRQQVEKLLRDKSPDSNQVRDLVRQLTPNQPPRPITPVGPMPPPDNPPPVQPAQPPMPPVNQPPPPPAQPTPLPPAPPESTGDWFRKQAGDWANSFTRGMRGLDNDTLKGIVEQIQKSGLAPSRLELPEWVKNATKDFSGDLKEMLPNLGGTPQALRDYLGNLRAPSVGEWSVSPPDLPSAESASRGLGLLLLLVLVALVGWVLWQTRGLGYLAQPDEKAARRVGPWPVPPDRVTSRSQLVQCFEYLARKVLGTRAETSHHHEVGRRLAQQAATVQQQQAADDLAELYEHARYLPPTETLPDESLQRARQALRLLATVTPA